MFTHVMVGAHDLAASKKFYDAVLGAIGLPAGQADPKGRIFYRTKTGVFGITKPIDGQPATHANGGTIVRAPAPSRRGLSTTPASPSGGKSIEDPPGWREGPSKFLSCLPSGSIGQQDLRHAAASQARNARLANGASNRRADNQSRVRFGPSATHSGYLRNVRFSSIATVSPYRGKRRNGLIGDMAVGT